MKQIFANALGSFIFVILFATFTAMGQTEVSSTKIGDDQYKIFVNRVRILGQSDIKFRDIYIVLNDDAFNKRSLERIFGAIQAKYSDPYGLMIIAYNDLEILKQRIQSDSAQTFIDFVDNESGKKAASEFYPDPSGYFRAYYYRNKNYHYFDYSPKKESAIMERIQIKKHR